MLAADPVTGEQTTQTVVAVWVHQDTLINLTIRPEGQLASVSDTSASVGQTTITTTADHPFWNHTDRQWQAATTLDPGDRLLAADNTQPTVVGLLPYTQHTGNAYNLTITGPHTYHVLADGWPVLVHNTCPEAARLTSSPNAPVVHSKTAYMDRSGRFRIDVENQNPGQPGANIHPQPMGRGASGNYCYHPESGQWISERGAMLAPRIARQVPQSAIDKAHRYLGIPPP